MVKACPIQLRGPRPIAEAISSAGGVRWSEVNENLMLRRLPGVFVAGEMIDWREAMGRRRDNGRWQAASSGAIPDNRSTPRLNLVGEGLRTFAGL